MKHPDPYDGSPDLEVFDNWMNSVLNYADIMKLRESTTIKMMAEFMTGTPRTFYTMNVMGRVDEWSYATIFPAIFDYCFPNDIMRKLRIRWDKLNQGKRRVREYLREIHLISARFSEITERAVVLKFWRGLNWELRELMALAGAEPELDDLQTMNRMAQGAEKGRDQRQYEREDRPEGAKKPHKREFTRFKNRTGGNQNYKPGNKDERSSQNKSEKVRANAVSPQNTPDSRPKAGPSNQKKLPRAKLDTLRAEGKCFNCYQQGHEQRNCPKLNSMKPPKQSIKSGSISLTKMDKLADQKEKSDFYFGQVSIKEEDPIADELKEFEDVEFRVHRKCEEAWGEDPLWYNEETRPECRWSIGADENEITVWDFEKGKNRTFDRKVFEDPKFNIAEIFSKPETIRTPTSVREGGYPLINEDYDRWEWPAINWMHARLSGQLELIDERNAPTKVAKENRIDVQPTMFGYSVQLDESDITYNLSHEEVLDKHFSPERIINEMIAAREIRKEERGDRFEDKRLTSYVAIMLGMTSVPGQNAKIKKRGMKKRTSEPEGVPAVERTTIRFKDRTRRLPEPIVVQVKINGQQIRALLDSGSMADFLSTTVADQLKLERETYQKPLSVQLAVHGSRSKINCGTTVQFQYQSISCQRRFDIANLDNYDAILGTPFLYQHQVAIGFNPSRVVVGSSEPLEMKGPEVTTINSAATDILNKGLNELRQQLKEEAEDLCPDTSKTALPPLRAVNHMIPIIDETKVYRFRLAKCPESFKDQWREKKRVYLQTGRWRMATGYNTIPLLMIHKATGSLRTVFDKREQNANTYKLASPLPDMEEILREVSRHKYRSLIDRKDAYEQIRIVPEHVS